MIPRLLIALGAALLFGAAACPASAHPHLWIDVAATVLFDKDRVSAIRFQWTFDEFFSAGVIGEFDKNNNKQFDPDELEPLRTGAFEGTKEAGFFTDIQIGGTKFDIQTTTDFAARIEKGVAVYEFTVPLPEPLDPTKTTFSFSVYDQSYFVDIGFVGHDPIALTGGGSDGCKVLVTEDRQNPIYGGVVYPKKAVLKCGS